MMVDKWNRVDLVIMILFITFAGLQWNDPDSALWVAIYLSIAVLAVLINLKFNSFKLNKLHTILAMMGSLFMTNAYFTNLKGSGSDFMSPEQEGLRELLGMYLVLGFSIYYIVRAFKKRQLLKEVK